MPYLSRAALSNLRKSGASDSDRYCRPADGLLPAAFRLAMQEAGYIADKNVTYVGRWAEMNTDRLPTSPLNSRNFPSMCS